MNLSALVITLRRSVERVAHVRNLIETCPVPCDIWDAVDGSRLEAGQLADVYQAGLFRPRYPFPANRGEIGCFLSHRGIWEKMVRESISQMLILEDDIELLPGFADVLAFAAACDIPDAYIQFQVRDVTGEELEGCGKGDLRLIRPTVVPLRTSAQLVTLGAARKLLAFSEQIDRPVDAAIQLQWLHHVPVLVALPRSVGEISRSLGGSTIAKRSGKRRSLVALARREWLRSTYRYRIAAASRRHAA